MLGLNIPYPVARYVGSVGMDNLDPKLKAQLPEVNLGNAKHRTQFEEAIGFAHGESSMTFENIDKMYQVQCLWEDYMSESCSIYLNRYPDSKLCVIAGLGHVKGRVGIPDRLGVLQDPFHLILHSNDLYFCIKCNIMIFFKRLFRIASRTKNIKPFVIVPEQVDWSFETGLPDIDAPLKKDDCDWAWYTEQVINIA